MIKMLRVVAAPGATLALIMMTTPGVAQAPTDAQREAIRSACRSDYIAHCSSVPPGGLESLQCLQKNMSSLSGTCKGAQRPQPLRLRLQLLPKPQRTPRQKSLPMRRSPRSAAPAAPTIQKCAPAYRPAAHRRCNAWTRTKRRFHRAVSKPSTPPVTVLHRQPVRLRPRPPLPVRLRHPQRHLPW
jgi:hypothetical protein